MTYINGEFEQGELRQASIWYKDEYLSKAKEYLAAAFDYDTQEHGVLWGPIHYQTQLSDDPPEEGAKLLIAESVVWGFKDQKLNFLMDLDAKDLHLLRDITQRAYQNLNPGKTLSVDKLDEMVARIGHNLAEKLLRENYHRTH